MAIGSPQWMYNSGSEYELDQSLRFNDDDSAYLSRTPSSAGNTKTWTWSGWVKRGNISGDDVLFSCGPSSSSYMRMRFINGAFEIASEDSALVVHLRTTALFRDSSAWYHIIVAMDTTQAISSNRTKFYINGILSTAFSHSSYPSLNADTLANATVRHTIGTDYTDTTRPFDGYIGEVNFIDGAQKVPADFGETGDYGEWKPKEYSGTYGTNGFYLPFKQDYTVEGFSTVTWKGTGATTAYVGGTGFQPDLVWMKTRDNTANHAIWDSVRGVHKGLSTSSTGAEVTDSYGLEEFRPDGFETRENTTAAGYSNTGSMVAWNWDMGGSNATNTDGSITSTVRANPTYGQSIVSWTNPSSSQTLTVGHGLGVKPDMIIMKGREVVGNWFVYHKDLATLSGLDEERAYLKLNATDSTASSIDYWADSIPTTSLIATTSNIVGGNSKGVVAYCFASKIGYSKFGSYSGTGSATGPSVTTGFKPAFLMVKNVDEANSWRVWDNTRDVSNPISKYLSSDSSGVEGSINLDVDFNSNGFQIKNTNDSANKNGNNYIYMCFADTREYAYWLDQSGNNNDWTSNNLTESDISVDSPTNNFATMNPLDKDSDITLYEGNTRAYSINSGGYACTSTISTDSGKWYAEINSLVLPASTRVFGGWALNNYDDSYSALDDFIIHNLGSYQRYVALGSNYDNVSTSFAAGDILQLAWDMDAGKFWFGKNGTWINSGNPTSGTNATVTSSSVDSVRVVYRVSAGAGTTGNLVFNFGQDSSFAGTKTAQGNQDSNDIGDFYYTPPTGFLALCTKNLPDVAVVPSEHFNTVLYTGTGITNRAITGVGFQPDLVWAKARNNAQNHTLFNSISGVTKYLNSNTTTAESTNSETLLSFDSDGYTLGNAFTNESAYTYAAWNWKANGSGSSNTNGTITSTVSANVDAGFSIVSYTGNGTAGATVGHGLSKKPEMLVVKKRDGTSAWMTANEYSGWTGRMNLDTTNAAADDGGAYFYGNTATPTNSVFYLGSHTYTNGSSNSFIAYCFHSVDGYSKVTSYSGNGSADGTYVHLGFRAMWIMVKRTDASGDSWAILDTKRNTINPMSKDIAADDSAAEYDRTTIHTDVTANGIKFRGTNGWTNASGGEYIMLAFAETPFKYSNAR